MSIRPSSSGTAQFVLLIAIACIAAARYNSYSGVLAIDVDLDYYRIPATTPENSFKITFYTSANREEWRIDYRDKPSKFAATFHDCVIESPSYTGGPQWRIVSPRVSGVPVDLDAEQRMVWFVYAGSKELDGQGTPLPVPFGDARLDAYVHGCRAFAMRGSSENSPARFEFRFDKELLRKNVDELAWLDDPEDLESRRRSFEQFAAGHTNGATVAALLVSDLEMFEGVAIPNSWEFVLNWYGAPAFRCTGHVLKTRLVQSMPPVTIPPIVRITDKRVRSTTMPVDNVNYMLTNASKIPDLQDQVVRKTVQRFTPADPRSFARMPRHTRSTRWFMIGVLCTVSSLPLVIFLGLKTLRNRKLRKESAK